MGIFLEDHYYSRSDAAVVFRRLDRHTGSEKYIYHGNDGTSMPWNDTAQLDFLKPEVREAVIQTILGVARKFSVIRFDAAMTLAKKHYRRLWFPEPGTGGAIPSRAESSLTKEQFDARMPHEFWREVVDRVAREVPDTLLLAEALFEQKDYRAAAAGLERLAEEELNPEFKWRRQYLLCHLQVAEQRLPAALAGVNLKPATLGRNSFGQVHDSLSTRAKRFSPGVPQ